MLATILILAVIGVGALFGVGAEPVTEENIRINSAHKTTFEIEKPFQDVFANLMSASKQCYLDKAFVEQITVAGEKNNSNKTGNIRIEHVYAMKPHEMYIMVDITSVDANKSTVTVYNADDAAQESLENYQQWALAKPEKC